MQVASPLMLAIDRRIFHIPLEEHLRARRSDLKSWTKTMLPTFRLSISEAQNKIRTGHQDIRTYFSDTAEPERNMNATYRDHNDRHHQHRSYGTSPNRLSTTSSTDKKPAHYATTSTNIRRPRYRIDTFRYGDT
jgi:hypothetical protein